MHADSSNKTAELCAHFRGLISVANFFRLTLIADGAHENKNVRGGDFFSQPLATTSGHDAISRPPIKSGTRTTKH